MKLTFLAYSDIHHHEYANGLVEQDLLEVEQLVLDLCQSRGADFYLFNGDLTLLKRPDIWIRDAANSELVKKNRAGFPGIIVLGNHDRDSKNMSSYHAFMHTKIYPKDLDLVHVIDDRSTLRLEFRGLKVEFHAVPAGHANELDQKPFDFQPGSDFRIGLFHDLLIGSTLGSGIEVKDGIPPEKLDRKEFDVVLGGDNHVHQHLDFNNTKGWYIGAPVQHNWGDSGQERGVMVVTLEKEDPKKQAKVTIERFQSKAPKFVRLGGHLINGALPPFNPADFDNNIVKINLDGPRDDINALDIPALEAMLRAQYGARSVKIVEEPVSSFATIIPEIVNCKTPQDDWQAYLSSDKVDVGNLDRARLLEMGQQVLKNIGV